VINITNSTPTLFDVVKSCIPDKSNSEIRRLITQNAVAVDGEKVIDDKMRILGQADRKVKIGKLGFFLVKFK